MAYSRSPPPLSPSSQEDWLSRGPQSVKTYSTSSSSRHASRSQSLASASNRAFSSANYESTARIYYIELKAYLRELLIQEANEGPHPHRVAARQKLTRLSNLQFHELAMDVYDEVVRRNKNDKFLPFLAVKEEFHPKRNQARQKLATLPVARFQDLASDVYYELTRRYTSIAEKEDSYPPMPAMPTIQTNNTQYNNPQPSKSTNIVPVKGMISVENLVDDSDDDHRSIRSPGSYNKNTRSPISPTPPTSANSDTPKDYFNSRPIEKSSSSAEIEKMKSDYEYQVNVMTSRIKQLQDDLAEKGEKTQDRKIIRQMEEQYKKLNDKYTQLDREYSQQQDAVRDVKRETKQMLDELKRLAKVNEELLSEKEKVDAHILKLQDEVKEWQMKYEKARIELRSIKASSIIELDHPRNIINENFLQPSRDGLISQDHILTYQAHIDDLLLAARSSNPAQVINVMKNIVTVCRSITEEIESQENTLFTETKNALYELKTRFSVSLSDLLVAAKYHASGMGISPVSLLDRSAGHLTFVIVELVKLLGMTSSSPTTTSNKKPITTTANDYTRRPSVSTTTTAVERNEYSNGREKNSYYGSIISGKSSNAQNHHKSTASSVATNDGPPMMRSQLDTIGYKYSNNSNNDSSMYSSAKKQQQQQPYRKNSHGSEDLTPEELVKYLKTETDNIVQTIQNLLAALRLPQQNGEVHAIISSIVKIVATISELSKATCQTSAGYPYRNECDPVLNQLGQCSQRLTMIQSKFFVRGATATANAKRDLAKEAYEIAKFTKELITLFES